MPQTRKRIADEATPTEAPDVDEEAPHRALELDTPADAPLVTKIAHAMAEAGRVHKTRTNTDQGYKFAGAEAILAAVRLPLLKRGVILTPTIDEVTEETITSSRGTAGTRIKLGVTFTFRDGGDTLAFNWIGEGQDYGDKAYGKAYTNAVKTFVRTTWLLPTEHDDPEGSPSGERAAAAAAAPPWALEATRDRKAEALDALEPLIGRDRAKTLMASAAQTWGHVPDVVVGFVKGLAGVYAVAHGAEQARAEQDQAAEQADPPAPDGGELLEDALRDIAPDDVVTPQMAGDAGDGREPVPPATEADAAPAGYAPVPGSVEVNLIGVDLEADAVARLREAGCICEHPLQEPYADACPIAGHGIPF